MRARVIAVALAALGAGCASQPDVTQSQTQAVAMAARDVGLADTPAVRNYAPVDLRRAQDRLAEARAALREEDGELAEHLAYLAQRNAEIARVGAELGAVETEAEELLKQRERLRERVRNQRLSLQQRQIQTLREQLEELNPRGTDRGIVLTLSNVLFRFDSAQLTESAQDPLDRLAAFLNRNPGSQIRIEGHTDSVGPAEYNRQLALERAQSVADAMNERGVDSARMTVVSYGEDRPVASNETDAGRRQNRRVEFVIWRD